MTTRVGPGFIDRGGRFKGWRGRGLGDRLSATGSISVKGRRKRVAENIRDGRHRTLPSNISHRCCPEIRGYEGMVP